MNAERMRVLVVDDSLVYQSKIKAALAGVPWLEVIGSASNGMRALEALAAGPVDLITLDMEMPVLDGLETLRKLREMRSKVKVIVFSSSTKRGSAATLEALSLGADDFVAKPAVTDDGRRPEDLIRGDLLPKIQQFLGRSARGSGEVARPASSKNIDLFTPAIVVIASSTGGPSAHDHLFRDFHGQLRCPVLIVQHMPPVFTRSFAERLKSYRGMPFREVEGTVPLENEIYVAPGDYHMSIFRSEGRPFVRLDQGPMRNSVRPAADNLFESAAELYGNRCMGFVLTGMGEDGLAGARAVKKAGGGIMIQNRETCVVFGMPGAVDSAGLADAAGSLTDIKKQLERMILK